MSRIRAAKEWGTRPTEAVMMHEGFGHYNRVTGERKHPKGHWTTWDFLLANVHQLITDFTDSNGFLLWELEDPDHRMVVKGTVKVDRAEQAKQQVEKANAKRMERVPGSYVSLTLHKHREEDEYPTHTEFFAHMAAKDNPPEEGD